MELLNAFQVFYQQINSKHNPAIYWAKSMLWEHSYLQDICDFHHGWPF